ncbi:hypothetical protein [Flaviflagellibacter deserti]|uniref:hypothetical protein n=1 Tax=Flaviflagellibacter deserti TaxID=2267266 RepID=UPI0036D21CDF
MPAEDHSVGLLPTAQPLCPIGMQDENLLHKCFAYILCKRLDFTRFSRRQAGIAPRIANKRLVPSRGTNAAFSPAVAPAFQESWK